MDRSQYRITLGIISALFLALFSQGCEEEFSTEPPFETVGDTIFLDVENWYYINAQPSQMGQTLVYPFTYKVFGDSYDGFLVKSSSRVYSFTKDEKLDDRTIFLDVAKSPGDTLFKYSEFRYHMIIDQKRDDRIGDDVYYVLRRSRIGVKRFRERSLWVLSPKYGILAVAKYDIGPTDGRVTLDMIGDPDYFGDPSLIKKIKYYDHDVTWMVDRDRNIIYEFDKHKAILKSRDFKAAEDLYSYQFNKTNTEELIDFSIQLDNNNSIKLVAGDSCFFFSETLDLLRSTSCK